MEFDEGLKLAVAGRALLFVGAGFSRGAVNLSGNDFALGTDLGTELSKEAGLPPGLALDDAAELYVDKFGEDKLISILMTAFSAKGVAGYQEQVASIPWRRVYTTNYDDVFETACAKIGKRIDSTIPLDDSAKISKGNPLCVHLNGFIRRTDPGLRMDRPQAHEAKLRQWVRYGHGVGHIVPSVSPGGASNLLRGLLAG